MGPPAAKNLITLGKSIVHPQTPAVVNIHVRVCISNRLPIPTFPSRAPKSHWLAILFWPVLYAVIRGRRLEQEVGHEEAQQTQQGGDLDRDAARGGSPGVGRSRKLGLGVVRRLSLPLAQTRGF